MPMPNFHVVKMKPSKGFKNIRTKDSGEGVQLLLGKKKGSKAMEVISFRLAVDKFTPEQVDAWVAKLKLNPIEIILAEPKEAKGKRPPPPQPKPKPSELPPEEAIV